ncbi:MAG: hypothetical protein L6R40_005887 [Gallowayella cf. fulva]|nr:MAG: hypothetical protein L6R40_005887 [Xanthomendoza cf. fulva]
MIAQRFTQTSARRIFLQRPTSFTSTRFSVPAIVTAYKPLLLSRPAATQTLPSITETIPHNDANALLAAQRRARPVAPHLTIYQTQIPWTLSALNRITGSLLSGGFYVFGFAYLVSPLFGWHLESSALAASFAELPTAVKVLLKFGVALPFTFHSFNGVRHLVWDSGREFANKSVVRTGQVFGSPGCLGIVEWLHVDTSTTLVAVRVVAPWVHVSNVVIDGSAPSEPKSARKALANASRLLFYQALIPPPSASPHSADLVNSKPFRPFDALQLRSTIARTSKLILPQQLISVVLLHVQIRVGIRYYVPRTV